MDKSKLPKPTYDDGTWRECAAVLNGAIYATCALDHVPGAMRVNAYLRDLHARNLLRWRLDMTPTRTRTFEREIPLADLLTMLAGG